MNGLILFIGTIFILWMGRSIFVPIMVAVFFWYLINAISSYYRKAMPFKRTEGKRPNAKTIIFDLLSKVLSLATFAGLIYLFSTQIRPMFSELAVVLPEIQHKLALLGDYITRFFGISLTADNLPNFSKIAATIGASAASMVTSLGMIVVYMFFMFIEQSTFHKKFAAMFTNKTQFKKMSYIFKSIDTNMKKYLFMKTFISGITALLSYFWLSYLGLGFAGIWAFIVFVTSYIPTIGAIVACSLPILYSLVTADTMTTPILVAAGLIGLQIGFGNILEPKLTGKTLNLSTLAILINLVFWGMIWGVAGMFFSVPLLVATFIITAQFDSTRWIAVLLSADGSIPDKTQE